MSYEADKSYVSIEQKVCVVCGKTYDSGALLLDKRLKDSMEKHTVTGWGMCEEHTKLKDDGYVALIGCKNENDKQVIKPEDANRTGEFVHIKQQIFNNIFNFEAPKGMVVFCEQEVIERIKADSKGADDE